MRLLTDEEKPISRQNDEFERVLQEPWAVSVEIPNHRPHRWVMPAGTEYNPSAPGVSASVISMSRMEVASALHDPLYRLQGRVGFLVEALHRDTWTPVRRVSRQFADMLFAHLMRLQGVSEWKVQIAWLSIRSPLGWWTWLEEDQIPDRTLRAKHDPMWCRQHFG